MSDHVVGLAGSCALFVAISMSAAADPELVVDIDVNSEVWLRTQQMTEADVDELVGNLHDHGWQEVEF